MALDPSVRDAVLASVPSLRAFAISLCGNVDRADDLDWLVELYSDPDVTRYLGGTKGRTSTEEMFSSRILQYYDRHPGLGIWVTGERSNGRRAGFHLLNNIQGESFIQVGFTLARWAWGKGIATEMASAVLRYGFVDLALPRIVGIANLGNLASQQVLLKIGLHRMGERAFSHPAYAAEGPLAGKSVVVLERAT